MKTDQTTRDGSSLSDARALRAPAERHVDLGAVTAGYMATRETVQRLMGESLATEIVCVLRRYQRDPYVANGVHAQSVATGSLHHAAEKQAEADPIAARTVQLGWEPGLSPDRLPGRSHARHLKGRDLLEVVQEDLVAERIAIESYLELIRHVGDHDPTACCLLESILAAEEDYAGELISLLRGQRR